MISFIQILGRQENIGAALDQGPDRVVGYKKPDHAV
jgi:hypothetical protein